MKYTLEQLINHVNLSVENANNNISKLTPEILSTDGMSGNKTRHLYNKICSLNNVNYLEIGTWKGSSFISALYGNDINPIVIDNWVEFNGPKNEFISNVNRFCPDKKFNFIEKDCFKVTDDEITSIYDSIDIYLYDGAHDYESQRKAITYYKHLFSHPIYYPYHHIIYCFVHQILLKIPKYQIQVCSHHRLLHPLLQSLFDIQPGVFVV
jgi:hypothetical protein